MFHFGSGFMGFRQPFDPWGPRPCRANCAGFDRYGSKDPSPFGRIKANNEFAENWFSSHVVKVEASIQQAVAAGRTTVTVDRMFQADMIQ